MTRKILVPLDGSADAERAVGEAARLVPRGGEIHFLHVVPLPTPPVGMEPTRLLGLPDQALPYLEDVRRRLVPEAPGLDVVRTGDAAEAILQVALEMNIDLLAMSTHARRGAARWLLGSVAEAVVRRTQLPVVLVPPGAQEPRAVLRRILVPLDGSTHSRAILETVKLLAASTGAEVVVLHVKPKVPDPAPQWAVREPLAIRREPMHRLQEVADQLEEYEKVVAWPAAACGDPVEEILKHARTLEADLIAMTTHARAGLERAVVGSVAEGVLRGADRAVLVQKPLDRRGRFEEGEAHE
jgi:nucleotide-binding universal stress UspA family protein